MLEYILIFLMSFEILLSPATGNFSGIGFGKLFESAYAGYLNGTYDNSIEKSDYEEFMDTIKSVKYGDIAVSSSDVAEVTANEQKYSLGNFKIYSLDNYCTVSIPKTHFNEGNDNSKRIKNFTYNKSSKTTLNIKAVTGIEEGNIENYVKQETGLSDAENLKAETKTFGDNTFNYIGYANTSSGEIKKVYYSSVSNKSDALIVCVNTNTNDNKEELTTVIEYILKSFDINCNEANKAFDDSAVTSQSSTFDTGIIEIDDVKVTIPFELSTWLDENFELIDNYRFNTLVVNGSRQSRVRTPSNNVIRVTQINKTKTKKSLYASDVYSVTVDSSSFSDVPNVTINEKWHFGDSMKDIVEEYGEPNFLNYEKKSYTYVSTEKNYTIIFYYDDNFCLSKIEMAQHVSDNNISDKNSK